MLNTAKLRRDKRKRDMARLSTIAKRIREPEPDRLDELLAGLDDGWEHIRQAIIKVGAEENEWAGYPLPTHTSRLVIEPRHPKQSLNGATLNNDIKPKASDESEPVPEVVNSWTDRKRNRRVYICREAGGRVWPAVLPAGRLIERLNLALDTLGNSQAWSVAAEFTAMGSLKALITPTAFRYYLLTGSFLETSPRSGVTYLFRKLRPTIAMRCVDRGDGEERRILAALCLHPIGYYEQSFAGAMVPTDDLIAHLLWMRADEHGFWKKANHHNLFSAEAGL